MSLKGIPGIICLIAGVLACIIIFFNQYDLETGLKILLVTLIIFYTLGTCVKMILNKILHPISLDKDENLQNKNNTEDEDAEKVSEKEIIKQVN